MSNLSDMTGEEFERFINSGGNVNDLREEAAPTSTVDLTNTVVASVSTPAPVIKDKPDTVIQNPPPAPEIEPQNYPADYDDNDPEPDGGYNVLLPQLTSPALFLAFFTREIADGTVVMNQWQREVNEELAPTVPPTSKKPLKYYLVAANGSGKDAFVIAPFVAWFCFCKIQSRCIITSSSGGQLTAQTETYIKNLCESVNKFFGTTVFRIRQRYIKCLATGSEIRMFATDEAGKAEGYHPIKPDAEMAIVKNESKSIDELIHKALKRCTGYNYWLEVSSPGTVQGAFYYAVTTESWGYGRKITSFDCPHISEEERESDRIELGETSAEYRSKHLAEFTSTDSDVVIPLDIVQRAFKFPPRAKIKGWEKRVGIDLAAGGDETSLCLTQGCEVVKEKYFREKDTTITATTIDTWLKDNLIPKDHPHIYADDGGIGHAIIDMLVHVGWKIKRVLNQSAAYNKKRYGNRGAEMWFNVKRILEECSFDISKLSEKTCTQLGTRKYKQVEGGRMFLQSKKQAKAEGNPSPDRADAFVLTFVGLTILDFIDAVVTVEDDKTRVKLLTADAVESYYEDNNYGQSDLQKQPKKRANGSLQIAINNQLN